ncbi:Universal stress protein A-like protein [Vitis vinifera]|uniref:Universal stress protein A-like protein n=1 Tax=Vitis vinifera TaxID=29760 RepID=A0A438JIA1_VITVI|nr:Universal stress protein A-like protein [Vitis vinifera]
MVGFPPSLYLRFGATILKTNATCSISYTGLGNSRHLGWPPIQPSTTACLLHLCIPEDFKNLERRDKARGLQLLEHFVKSSHEFGVSCGAWIKKGDPKEVICHEVKRIQPDLLVVGCRGLGPFQRVFVGTVSEFCVKHAECPVITIKRRPDEIPQDPVDD